jgi:hypothetical protein
MANSAELTQLLARRQVLLEESARLREQLFEDVRNLQKACGWVDRGYSLFFSLRSWWPVLAGAAAGAAGLFIGTKQRGFIGRIGKAWSLWRVARKGVSLWQEYFSGRTHSKR